MPLSLAAAVDDLQRLTWTLRRKPLESLLAPQAAVPLEGGGGALVCHDGSLVSLIRLDGARSMMGADELDRFVGVAAQRLNTALSAPGHALHIVFERAPDEAGELVEAHAEAARRQGERLSLDLDDLLAERAQAARAPASRPRPWCWRAGRGLPCCRATGWSASASGFADACATGSPRLAGRSAHISPSRVSGPATRRCSIRCARCSPRPGSWAPGWARTRRSASSAAW